MRIVREPPVRTVSSMSIMIMHNLRSAHKYYTILLILYYCYCICYMYIYIYIVYHYFNQVHDINHIS